MRKNYFIQFSIFFTILFSAGNICTFCRGQLQDKYTRFEDKIYHPKCFDENIQMKCEKCNQGIDEEYMQYNGKNFHTMCYKNLKFKRCRICTESIRGNYLEDVWGNPYHEHHASQGEICYHCLRLISEGITYGGYQLDDGRFVCSLCKSQSIKSETDIEKSRNTVVEILENVGFKKLPRSVPIFLVNQKKLALYSGEFTSKLIQGYTKSKNGEYAIYILNHIPVIEFEAILAHEYLHIWQYEHKINVTKSRSEGISCLGNELIYKQYKNDFSAMKLLQLEKNNNPNYGIGYRNVKKILDEKGWNDFIISVINDEL